MAFTACDLLHSRLNIPSPSMNPTTLKWARPTALLSLAWLLGLPVTALAEIFTMRCNIEGTIPALEDKKIPAAEVSIEIQSIGNNLYFKVQGAKPYEMFINTLTTDQFVGKNLTNPSSMGIQQKTVANGEVRELRLARGNMALSGYADIPYQRKTQRMNLQGQCKPA